MKIYFGMEKVMRLRLLFFSLMLVSCQEKQPAVLIIEQDSISEWHLFTLALIGVESEFDSTAVNKRTGARGILQIMPIFVREVNRLQSEVVYTWDDAFSVEKSIEMLNIMNPNEDVERAIVKHNGRSKWYRKRVLDKMEEYKKIFEMRERL